MRTGEYPDDWDDRRERVLERDDYQCQRCGATDTTLHVHHVTPISKGGSHRLSNLETLCESCHAEEHPVQTTLRSALAQNRRIKMKYHSSSGTRIREVDPYGVEVHEGIQYMVGHDYYRDEIRHFRPTRIEWVTMTDTEFFPPAEFDTTAYLSRNLKSRQKADKEARSVSLPLPRMERHTHRKSIDSGSFGMGFYYSVRSERSPWTRIIDAVHQSPDGFRGRSGDESLSGRS